MQTGNIFKNYAKLQTNAHHDDLKKNFKAETPTPESYNGQEIFNLASGYLYLIIRLLDTFAANQINAVDMGQAQALSQ